MNRKSLLLGLAVSCSLILGSGRADARNTAQGLQATLVASGLAGAIGSTIGPDGALYVAQGTLGTISRVDLQTGKVTTFASGLPKATAVGLGGPMDVAFIGKTAYALETLVGADAGGDNVVGIYRVNGPNNFTVVADIGAFNTYNQPTIPFTINFPSGVPFGLQPYHGGFLVTDGHLNRVLQVTLHGAIKVVMAFKDIVPTGMAVSGNTVYMAEAGPVPHRPRDGKVVMFGPASTTATEVASGASLLVAVKFGSNHHLYALSQGNYSGNPPGSPALPNTGALVEVNMDGTFSVITSNLDRPASLNFVGDTAYVVTLTGQVWKINNVSGV